MKALHISFLLSLLLSIVCFGSSAHADVVPERFLVKADKKFFVPLPKVTLSDKDTEKIYAKSEDDQFTTLVETTSPEGDSYKIGYMEVVIDYDPVTVWQIISDKAHYHATDPAFPENKGRRTMMPLIHWGNVCEGEGPLRLFQYLVLPFPLSNRKYQLVYSVDENAFPWENSWVADKDLSCAVGIPEEFTEAIEKAVQVTHNNGAWRIQPLPPERIKTVADFSRTYIRYIIDSNPGGTAGSIGFVVNKATTSAMNNVCKNVRFHASRWEEHLKTFFGPEKVASWKEEQQAYLSAMHAQYPDVK